MAKGVGASLFSDIRAMIESSRRRVAVSVNAELSLLYWNVGRRRTLLGRLGAVDSYGIVLRDTGSTCSGDVGDPRIRSSGT